MGIALKCELACEVLRSTGSLRVPAVGRSMVPTIWPGDTLAVVQVTMEEVNVGDIVVTRREGCLVSHRVVSIADSSDGPLLVTQGDAAWTKDQPVRENEVLGRVVYVISAGKRITVSRELNVAQRFVAKMVRRSPRAASVLVYLHSKLRTQQEFLLPCQG